MIPKEKEPTNAITLIDFDKNREISLNMELKTLMDKWLKYKKEFIAPSTYSEFILISENHIKPFFTKKKIKDIHEGQVQDFVNFLHKSGRKDGNGGFKLKTIRDIVLPLKLAFNYANKYNKSVEQLDWSIIEFPKERKNDKVKALTYEQQKKFIQAVYLDLNAKTVAYLISLFTGLRIGEVCGLQMKDISLEQKTISVNKTVYRTYDKLKGATKLVIGKTKTESSERVIPFPEMLTPLIEKFYDSEKIEYFFITNKKQPIEPRTLRQSFVRFLKRHELPGMKFHELRHTFATRAMEIPEFDIKSLSAILGHKNPSFTLNVYGRSNIEQEFECMKLMNRLF